MLMDRRKFIFQRNFHNRSFSSYRQIQYTLTLIIIKRTFNQPDFLNAKTNKSLDALGTSIYHI